MSIAFCGKKIAKHSKKDIKNKDKQMMMIDIVRLPVTELPVLIYSWVTRGQI